MGQNKIRIYPKEGSLKVEPLISCASHDISLKIWKTKLQGRPESDGAMGSNHLLEADRAT